MKRSYQLLFLLTLLAALITACSPATSPGVTDSGFAKNAAGYADITIQQLAEMLPNKDFTLVNVHIPYEGELAHTDLFIAYNRITDNLEQLPDKEAPIVLYCRSGRMSAEAAEELARLGYSNIMELDGGFIAWQAAGYEVLYR